MTTRRYITFLFSLMLLGLTSIQAQTIELTPIYGYQFGTKLEFGSSYLKIADSDEYGLSVGYEVDYGLYLEAAWIHNSTELLVRDRVFSPNEQRLSDLSADWAQLGAVKYFKIDNIRPYFGGGAGLVFLSTKDENRDLISRDLDNDTKFFFAFKGGVQIMFTDLIGLNLQGNLRFPVDWGGFYVGVGSAGASSGVALESTTVVGGFSAGLVFKLNGSDK